MFYTSSGILFVEAESSYYIFHNVTYFSFPYDACSIENISIRVHVQKLTKSLKYKSVEKYSKGSVFWKKFNKTLKMYFHPKICNVPKLVEPQIYKKYQHKDKVPNSLYRV